MSGLAILVERSNSRPPTVQPIIDLDGSDYLNTRLSLVRASRFRVSEVFARNCVRISYSGPRMASGVSIFIHSPR